MLSLHMHREETVTHEIDLSQKSVERTQKYLERLLTKFSRQGDLAPIRTAQKGSTANLQQPHQPAQYIPFASVIFSSQTPKQFLTQIHTHTHTHKSAVSCSNFKFNHFMSLLLRINVVRAMGWDGRIVLHTQGRRYTLSLGWEIWWKDTT